MATKKSSSLLRAIVSLAKSLGELNHRSFLLKEELKAVDRRRLAQKAQHFKQTIDDRSTALLRNLAIRAMLVS